MSDLLVRKNVTSLYEQIASHLREEALSGIFDPSGKLPSEAELMARFDVSRVTVRLALKKLEDERVVERKQGKGTYVAGRQVRHALDALRSFHDSLLMQGLQPTMQLLAKDLIPVPKELSVRFGRRVTHCTFMQRLHLVDGEPIAVGGSYLPQAVADLPWEEAEMLPNYTILRKLDGQGVARADVAVRAQLADRQMAKLLQIKTGSAVLVMTRISCFANGDCCDYSTFYIRPERYEFVASCTFNTVR
ncbi:MAG: GntR family transcriptional regulator [Oxalicibacterium faecigallinarum]|nr:GntR family transcriptional regulator [Oxalicibacterium faecigallinarum]MDQ7968865.1 GntR family transcriptional regulator [Oxalicibacterium faecigallinarum]